VLNGDIPQSLRERTIERLKDGKVDVLVATDVAARGLDVERIGLVVNYDVPFDSEAYVHRIGRTGRAGREGDAILFLSPRERRFLYGLERAVGCAIEPMEVPSDAEINQQRLDQLQEKLTCLLTEPVASERQQEVALMAEIIQRLSRETEATRKAYGENNFGRQTLIARRLLERGVRFIQLWTGAGQPWDSHDEILDHARLAKDVDQAIAAFMGDMKQRGLFDDTLMIWGGEFGRTPVVELPTPGSNAGKQRGRDHNHYGFSYWLAGGGSKGGYTHGATDEFGFAAIENKVHVHDLHATLLKLLGFDHERFTYRYAGLDFRLTGVNECSVVQELIA
jgi:uncharacterized protein (DUF1501 family)